MVFRMLGPTVKNLVRRPATRRYPFEPYLPHAGTRGKIVIEYDKCIFCLLCDKKCPTGAIHVDRPGKVWQIDRLRCIQCNHCVELCPRKCLAMDNHYASAVIRGGKVDAIERHAPRPAGEAEGSGEGSQLSEPPRPEDIPHA